MEVVPEPLSRLWAFAAAMKDDVARVDRALPELLRLLEAADVEYRVAGGLAVLHHGYARTTEDIDILVEVGAETKLAPHLAAFGFLPEGAHRLRHAATAVRVDLLVEGEPMPRGGAGVYPSPRAVSSSPRDPHVIDLVALIELKLRAHRHQDLADVVALLKRMDEGAFLSLEATIAAALRGELLALRRDALEEASWEEG